MLKRNLRKTLKAFALVSLAGVPMVLASVPRSSEIANDTAIYQNLHEIKVTKINSLNFDSDINRLSAQEKSHREALPVQISAPMNRVMKTPYAGTSYRKSAPQKARYLRVK